MVEKKIKLTIKIFKNLCFSVIQWKEKHLLKQVVPLSYKLEKKLLLLKVCESFLFRQSISVYRGLLDSPLGFKKKRRPNK